MSLIKKAVFILGSAGKPMKTRELAKELYNTSEVNQVIVNRTGSLLRHYRRFFRLTGDGLYRDRSLNAAGLRFYSRIKDTYDPVTDTQILPQK